MEEDLRSIVAKVLDVNPEQVTDDLQRGKIETWDSMNHLLLVSEIESEMGIDLTTDEVLRINSFKDIREIVSRKKQKRPVQT